MEATYWPDGTLKEVFDFALGVYSLYDEMGAVVEKRLITDLEKVSHNTERRNSRDLTDKVAAQIPDLLVMIEDLNARLDIPEADLSNREWRRTMRDVKQLARIVTQLARLVGRVLDSTDSGTP